MATATRSPLRLSALLLLAALLAIAVAACGGDGDSGSEEETVGDTVDITISDEPPPPDPLELAGIDTATGAYEDYEPDARQGASLPQSLGLPLARVAAAAGCELRTGLRDEGADHLAPGDPAPSYGTDPATSGDHDPVPIADGAYLEAPPEPGLVHSLEHGRVVIHYDPGLPEPTQLALKGLFDDDPRGMLLVPDPEMPYAVAATAWRRLLGCESAAGRAALAEALVAFRDEFRGKGPERIPL